MEMKLGDKIRPIRALKGLSQEFIADKLGISQRAYSKLEMNQTRLDWEKITRIAGVFEIDPLDMVSFDDNLIFNNCTQSGKFQNFVSNIPDLLIEQYESRIKNLEGEILFLREELRRK